MSEGIVTAKPEEENKDVPVTSIPLAEALLSSSLTAALGNTDTDNASGPVAIVSDKNSKINDSKGGRKRKKVVFCRHLCYEHILGKSQGCTNYSREGGYCIRHGGGKRCVKKGCDTRCYALGFCFKHGNEAYNSSEYEDHHIIKKAKCKKCSKVFEAPICYFSSLMKSPTQTQCIVQGSGTKAFCELHARQILLALREQGVTSIEDLETHFELPSFAETKNLKKATCYSNKKRLCEIDGCKSLARKKGKCQKHAVKSECKVDNCTGKAQSRGLCGHHGGGKRCKTTKCFKVAKLGSKFCAKHIDIDLPNSRMVNPAQAMLSSDNDMVLPDIKTPLQA